jgi:hypothetical protein
MIILFPFESSLEAVIVQWSVPVINWQEGFRLKFKPKRHGLPAFHILAIESPPISSILPLPGPQPIN